MSDNLIKILLIEDDPEDIEIFQEILTGVIDGAKFRLESAGCLSAALERLARDGIDIVLLDLGLPDSQGLDTLDRVNEAVPHLPIVVLTGLDDQAIGKEAIRRGAQDYLVKGQIDGKLLPRTLFYAIERKRMKEALRESEEKLRNIIEHSTDTFYSHTPEHVITYMGPRVKEILGYEVDEVMVRWTELTSDNPINEKGFKQTVKAIETGKPQPPYELEFVHKSGKKVWIEVRERPVVIDGKTISIVGAFTDITDRKQAEEEIKQKNKELQRAKEKTEESEEYYHNLYENISDCIFVVDVTPDLRFKYIDFNPAEEKTTGLTTAQVNGKYPEDILPAEVAAQVNSKYSRCITEKKIITYEEELNLPTGLNYYTTSLIPLKNKSGRIYRIIGVSHDITERKQAEDRLAEKEKELRLITESTIDTVFMLTKTGTVVYLNRSAEKLYNRKLEEMLGTSFTKYVPKKELPRYFKRLKGVFLHKEINNFESYVVNRDGQHIPVEINGRIIKKDGKYFGLGTIRDITERRRAEEALRESEDKYRTLYDSSRDAIMILTIEQGYISANSASVKMFGCKDEKEFIFKNPWDLSPEYQAGGTLSLVKAQKLMKIAMEKGSHSFDWKHKRINGKEFFASVLLNRMELQGKEILQATVRDITERKKAEDALREKEEYARAIFEQSPISIQLFDKTGLTLNTNKAWGELWQIPSDELIGKYNILEDEYARETGWLDFIEKAFEGETNFLSELEYDPAKSGNPGRKRTLKCVVFPIKNKNGEVDRVVLMHEDITERKRAEEERNKLYAELKEAYARLEKQSTLLVQTEKMSAVGTMAAGVAHELNNPLMGILNFAQYCRKNTNEDDKRYSILEDIEHETGRCMDIVKSLLTFSHAGKEDTEEYQKQSCKVIIERVVNLLSYRIEKQNVSLNAHISEETSDIWMKENKLQDMFLNLLTNSLDALEESDQKEIAIDVRPQEDHIKISVTDSGCGIEQDKMKRIFDPFFTTKAVGKGTGLGLAIIQNIIAEHGGEIQCESKPGEGTRFEILLPVERRRRE